MRDLFDDSDLDNPLESSIESDAVKYAEHRGWWVAKFVSPGKRAVPDRIFIRRARILFVELKRPGEKPTPQQEKRHREMRNHGAEVHWVDNLTDAYALFR